MLKINWVSFSEDTPAEGMWDQAFLKDTLQSIAHYDSERVVVVIPGAGNKDKYAEINEYIAQFEKVLVVITSDEESHFDTNNIAHADMIVYSQYPTVNKSFNVDFWLPIGYTPHIRPTLKTLGLPEKDLDWYFSGQITHSTREELFAYLKDMDNGVLNGTKGFTQGVTPEEYGRMLSRAKVVPSPAGAVKPEAFRTYEALEAGAVPIMQGKDYHNKILNEYILPFMQVWEHVKDTIDTFAASYPHYNNLIQAWWINEKQRIKEQFMRDLNITRHPVTVLMSTSPIKTNPSTEVIEKVIQTVRWQLPEAKIVIMADGVREEQEHFRADYEEFLRKVLWKANLEWDNVSVLISERHLHQTEMTKRALETVTTQLVLFVEHDMPFYEREIDWENTIKLVQSNKIKVMRYHFENTIPEPHNYLMLDKQPIVIDGVPLIRTAQWSQRPHLVKTDFYKELLDTHTTKKANCMIEDAVYGRIADNILNLNGWDDYRMAIYAPEDGFCFAYHLDGRLGENKFETEQVF